METKIFAVVRKDTGELRRYNAFFDDLRKAKLSIKNNSHKPEQFVVAEVRFEIVPGSVKHSWDKAKGKWITDGVE